MIFKNVNLIALSLLIVVQLPMVGCGGVIAGGERSGGEEDGDKEEDDGFTKSVESVPIAGINLVDAETFDSVCEKKKKANKANAYELRCRLAKRTDDKNGLTVSADGFANGASAKWANSVAKGSANGECEVLNDGLNYLCEFESASAVAEAIVNITATVKDKDSERSEVNAIPLFFELFVSAGLVPNAARSFVPGVGLNKVVTNKDEPVVKDAVGQVATAFSAAMEFHSITAACGNFFSKNERAFFAWNKYGFEYLNKNTPDRRALNWDETKNMIVPFYGATKTNTVDDLSDRRRTALSTVQFDLLCGDGWVMSPDINNNRILKFYDSGKVEIVNDTVPSPLDLQYDSKGNLFILSGNKYIYRLSKDGELLPWVDATSLHYPFAFFRELDGSFIIADFGGHRVVRVGFDSNGDSTTTLLAGKCVAAHNASDGDPACELGGKPPASGIAATQAVSYPTGVTKDRNGRVYISLFYRGLYYLSGNLLINVTGELSDWPYNAAHGESGLLGTPNSDDLAKYAPYLFVEKDAQGWVVFDTGTGLNQIQSDGTNTVIIGPGGSDSLADGCSGAVNGFDKRMTAVGTMTYDADGNLNYVDRLGFGTEYESMSIAQMTESGRSSEVVTLQGCNQTDEMKIPESVDRSAGMVRLSDGNFVFSNPARHIVLHIDADTGVETIIAGADGTPGDVAGAAGTSRLNTPTDLAVDSSDNVYVADYDSGKIKVISGIAASTGTTANLSIDAGAFGGNPESVDVTSDGSLIIVGAADHKIYKWEDIAGDDTVTAIAGTGDSLYSSSDHASEEDGAATAARTPRPRSVRLSYNVNSDSYDVVFVQFDQKVLGPSNNNVGYSGDDTSIVRKLLNDGSNAFTIKTLFGGGDNVDCGSGYVKAKSENFSASQSEICQLKITAISVNDSECQADDDGTRYYHFANQAAEYSNIVALRVPCKAD